MFLVPINVVNFTSSCKQSFTQPALARRALAKLFKAWARIDKFRLYKSLLELGLIIFFCEKIDGLVKKTTFDDFNLEQDSHSGSRR